jgi:hypothetical protein
LKEIEAGDLLAILDTLQAKGRVQETRHVLILVQFFFAHAMARQRIKRNPPSDIPMKLIGVSGTRDRGLEPDEIGKLLAALDRADFRVAGSPSRSRPASRIRPARPSVNQPVRRASGRVRVGVAF